MGLTLALVLNPGSFFVDPAIQAASDAMEAPSSTPLPQTIPDTLTEWKVLPLARQQAINVLLLKTLRQQQLFQQPIYRESDYLKWAQALQSCLAERSEALLIKAAEACSQSLFR